MIVNLLNMRWNEKCKWWLNFAIHFVTQDIIFVKESFAQFLHCQHSWHPTSSIFRLLVLVFSEPGDYFQISNFIYLHIFLYICISRILLFNWQMQWRHSIDRIDSKIQSSYIHKAWKLFKQIKAPKNGWSK